ncbi:MAG: DNA mismatch repair protein MutS [uncultured bacterium (gcode 4)]|uniref:DNA mismatch repair protein MutS n=1 Tax=uncultured bacterium (gcode 4) TaxID=1234023 RepID=K2GD02_9BACT|nr:MAG: DNA mismatch repair protein MutS [uncultured bacterium (gcode 4)]
MSITTELMNLAPDDKWKLLTGKSMEELWIAKSVETTKQAANNLIQGNNQVADYNIDKLYDPLNITRPFIHSMDGDFSMWVENPFSWEEIKYPNFLKSSREWSIIWNMVRFPIIDKEQIIWRQDFIKNIYHYPELAEIAEIKALAYWLMDWVAGLFSMVNVNQMHLPLIEAFKRWLIPANEVSRYFKIIDVGHENLNKLMDQLDKFESDSIKNISKSLRYKYQNVAHIKEDYLLSSDAGNVNKSVDTFYDEYIKISTLIEVASITKRDWLNFAAYNESEPVSWKNWWYIVEDKENWIKNDSTDDNSLTLLTWSNMSWKSSILKNTFFMQCMAQSFWVVPCEKWNFHIHDSFFYIDRSSTDHEHNLSAFWDWIKTLISGLKTFKKRPFWCYDEIFSETWPEDQYRLAAATIIYLKKLWAKIFCASHNEKFIELCDHLENVWIYHLKVKQSDWNLEWLYKLQSWADDSYAIEVARTLWLKEEILKIAENYLKGVYEDICFEDKQKYKDPEFREPDEDYFKENQKYRFIYSKILINSLIRLKPRDDNFVHIFSDDNNFKECMFRWSSIYTWLKGRTHERFWWMRMIWNDNLAEWVLQMLMNSPMISSNWFAKRRDLFNEISEKIDFNHAKNHGNELKLFLYFLWFINSTGWFNSHNNEPVMSHLHNFNKFIIPHEYQVCEELNNQLIIFLMLNKEILRDSFPFDNELEFTKKLQKAHEMIKKHLYSQPLWKLSEDVIEQLVNRRYSWCDYEIDDFEWKCKQEYKLLIEAFKHMNISNFEEINLYELEQIYNKISSEAEKITNEQDWAKTYSHATAITNYLNFKVSSTEFLEVAEFEPLIVDIRKDMESFIPESLDFFRWWYDLDTISRYMSYFYTYIKENSDKMRSISIFELDIREYQDKIWELLEPIIKSYAEWDYKYEETWPTRLIASIILKWFAQKINPVDSFLRDFDKLESEWWRFINEDFKKGLVSNLKEWLWNNNTGSISQVLWHIEKFDLYWVFKTKFESEIWELFSDFKWFNDKLEEFKNKFWHKSNLLIDEIDFILENKEVNGNNRDKLKKLIWNILHNNQYIYDRKWWEEKFEFDFQGIIYSELEEIKSKLKDVINLALKLEIKYDAFKWYSSKFGISVNQNDFFNEMNKWNFRRFKLIMEHRVNHFIDCRSISAPIKDFVTLALYWKMAKDFDYWEFHLNENWKLRIEEMFNIFSNPWKQVRNTDNFQDWEKWKILTGTNMSWKTFNLKALTMSVVSWKSTWKTTWANWEIPNIDNVIYMDRVVSKKDKKLSSFWNEVSILNKIIGLADEWRDILFIVDEMLSTTSPKYQAALVYGIIVYILKKRNYVTMASHNHEVVEILCNKYSNILKAYHNKIEFDSEWKIIFDYKLQTWHADSNAIFVAEKMWLPQEIIQIAKGL